MTSAPDSPSSTITMITLDHHDTTVDLLSLSCPDVQLAVLKSLDYPDMANMTRVCRGWKRCVERHLPSFAKFFLWWYVSLYSETELLGLEDCPGPPSSEQLVVATTAAAEESRETTVDSRSSRILHWVGRSVRRAQILREALSVRSIFLRLVLSGEILSSDQVGSVCTQLTETELSPDAAGKKVGGSASTTVNDEFNYPLMWWKVALPRLLPDSWKTRRVREACVQFLTEFQHCWSQKLKQVYPLGSTMAVNCPRCCSTEVTAPTEHPHSLLLLLAPFVATPQTETDKLYQRLVRMAEKYKRWNGYVLKVCPDSQCNVTSIDETTVVPGCVICPGHYLLVSICMLQALWQISDENLYCL